MSDYTEFFLNSNSNIVKLETLEITHPSFSKVYRIVRNAINGISATLENGQLAIFDYYPASIDDGGTRDDLDQSITISLGDLGEVVPKELDRVANANTYDQEPLVIYRVYRSDDLSAPLFTPILLEIDSFSFNETGCSFTAKAPSLNIDRTGEVYSFDRFPGLRGTL